MNDADKCGPKVRYLCVSVYPNVPPKGYLLIKDTFYTIRNLPSIDLIQEMCYKIYVIFFKSVTDKVVPVQATKAFSGVAPPIPSRH